VTSTAVYKRLPPDAGTPDFDQQVHLSGFRDIRIPSRALAERQIHDFLKYCEKDATQPAARMILGSWGEGKTEAFHRYIVPQTASRGHRAFRVTSRSIVNAYGHYTGLDTSEARLFLAAVLHVLREEGVRDIPPPRASGLVQWVEQCLRVLGCHKRKVFLFIDEVEQLLHEPGNLRRLMLGIKQLLDGDFAGSFAEPALASSLFVFFACTPEAYNRIATDPDVRQVFGGYGRRMDRIQVESISLGESVQFLHELLRYAWDGKLPTPMPVSSPGILVALATIAKRNMGHMVSLTSRLLSAGKQENGRIAVIGPEQLMKFAAGRTINIEGTDAKLFEDQLYTLLIRKMQEVGAESPSFQRLMAALLFDQRARSTSQVAEVIGSENWRGLESLWLKFLNQALGKMGHTPGLLAFRPVGQVEVLFENLERFVDRDRKDTFRFGEKLIARSTVEDLIADWGFSSQGELQRSLLAPLTTETIQNLFGPIPAADADCLLHVFRDLATPGEDLYRLPHDLLDQLFPPPCPPGLEFIRDASERFSLWRRAIGEYERSVVEDLPKALVTLGSRGAARQWSFDTALRQSGAEGITETTVRYKREDTERFVHLKTWLLARGRFQEADLRQCESVLQRTPAPPHLWLILTTDPVEDRLIERMSFRLRRRCCLVHVHPTYAKQMIASYWHLNAGGAVYEDTLARICAGLLERDLRLYVQLDRWLSDARRVGYAVDTPALSQGTHRGLVNALRLLLNTQGTVRTLQETFDWNRQELRRLVPYGSRGGLVPETDGLESIEGFRALVGDLQTNGFVNIDSENRPQTRLSPCETVILDVLKAGELHKDDWRSQLLILSTPETLVEELYVETLVQRGLVERIKKQGRGTAKNFRRVLPPSVVCDTATQLANDFRQRIGVLSQNAPSFLACAHMAIAKERDVQVITLSDIQSTIDDRMNRLQPTSDKFAAPANAIFLQSFLENVGDSFLDIAREAHQHVETCCKTLRAQYSEYVSQRVPQSLSVIPALLNIAVDVPSLAEIVDLQAVLNSVEAFPLHASPPSRDYLIQQIQGLDESDRRAHFWFDSLQEPGRCHNYFAYKALAAEKAFAEKRAALDRHLAAVSDKLQSIVVRRETLYRQAVSYNLTEDAPVSRTLLALLSTKVAPAALPAESELQPHPVSSVREILQIIDEQSARLAGAMTTLETCHATWQRIWEAEVSFHRMCDQAQQTVERATRLFNLPNHAPAFHVLDAFLGEGRTAYADLGQQTASLDPAAFEQVRKELVRLAEHFEQVNGLIRSELWDPFVTIRTNSLATLDKRIHACEALKNLPPSLQESYRNIVSRCEMETSLEAFLDGPISCSEELLQLTEISRQANDILARHLTEHEQKVLSSLINVATTTRKPDDISIDLIKDGLGPLSADELFGAVLSLWQKGVCSVRIRL
jgi:hypothetical protein